MTRMAALVLAAWTAAGAANAQTIRIDFDNGNRGGDSIREVLRGQPAPATPQGREIRGDHGPRRGDGRGPRRGGGREDRMRGAPDRWDGGGVRRLAERIEADAERLYRDYDQNSRTGNFFGKISRAAGLQSLRSVADAARRFRREVDSRWSDPFETRENYRELVRALDQADDEFFLAYKADTVREQYRRVSDSIDDLVRYYRHHDRMDRDPRGPYRPPYGRERCEGVSMWGKWYEGGGCGIHGCWRAGGGCGSWGCWSEGGGCGIHGCWTYGGGCNSWGCWRQGGNCGIHGCIGQVPSQPVQSQVCVE